MTEECYFWLTAPIVSWYRNNQLIKPSKYFRMESSPDGTHSLSILEAFPEDSGNYRCVARNKAGETTCGALLKVQGQSLYSSLYSERRKYFVD